MLVLWHTIQSAPFFPSWICTLFPTLSFYSEIVVEPSRDKKEKERFVEKATLGTVFRAKIWFLEGLSGVFLLWVLVFFPSTLAQYLNQRLLTLNWEWAWALPITTDVMSSLPPFFRILPSPKAPSGNIRVGSVARHTCWSRLWGGVKGRNVCDSWGQIALI